MQAFWGKQERHPRQAQNDSREQENETDFEELLCLGDGAGVRLSLHRQRLSSFEPPTILKEVATGLAPSFIPDVGRDKKKKKKTEA